MKEDKNRNADPVEPDKAGTGHLMTRRHFLKVVGAVTTAAGVGVIGTGCEPVEEAISSGITNDPLPLSAQYPAVPYTPAGPPPAGTLRFFTPHEARTVEALTARLLPGTPDDPGAREAGVVYYIDNVLAAPEGFNEPIYRRPPFAQVYEGDAPPTGAEFEAYEVIWVPAEEIERYGYQSILTPREVFRLGLALVDRYANDQFSSNYVALSEETQDSIIDDLLNNRVTGLEMFAPSAFFHILRRYTSEGMFSDPAYGGNRNMVGWQLIGYPGAQRAYTPNDLKAINEPPRPPQSLAELHAFNPGEPRPDVVLPVRGSEEHEH